MENADLAISKLIILTIASRIPAIPTTRLTNLSLETLYMDYFTYIQAFQELVRDKMLLSSIRKGEEETDASGHPVERCDITSQGAAVLATLDHKIPLHVKTYLHPVTQSWNKHLRREHDIRTELDPDANGQYQVTLSQHDGTHELVRLTLTIPDRQMARRICHQWKSQPGSTYVALLALLTGEQAITGHDLSLPEGAKKTTPAHTEPAQPYPKEQRLL